MPGWATQVFAREFDTALGRLPQAQRVLVLEKITELGRRLETFPHYRMTGRNEYRVIYRFDAARGEIQLITLGHRREVYR